MGNEHDPGNRWHWDKTVNLGHLLTTISAIVAMAVVASTFHTRLAIVEQQLATQQAVNRQVQEDFGQFKQDVRSDLREIIHKLDRIVEQRSIERGKP